MKAFEVIVHLKTGGTFVTEVDFPEDFEREDALKALEAILNDHGNHQKRIGGISVYYRDVALIQVEEIDDLDTPMLGTAA